MQRIRLILCFALLATMSACIKPFSPEIEGDEASKLVISGRITNAEGWQEVNISLSSPVKDAEYIPLSGCQADIRDNRGNIFTLAEITAGSYQVWISQEYLQPGTAYMVSVRTPAGDRIESAYDTLIESAPLDSVYYAIEEIPTTDPGTFNKNMQFYVDLIGEPFQSRFYKWEIKETWEYHSPHPLEYYYDGKWHDVMPPDYSKMVCWTNIMVKDVFLLSTKKLSQNLSLKNPLHFIDGHTSRLSVLYSILVTQQSLTESTYNYFEVVKANSSGFGGLYEQQPFSLSGNLVNLTSPAKDVLGYFYACSVSSKRYFYHDIEGLELDFWDFCNEDPLPISGWAGFKPYQYPVYYFYTQSGVLRILSDECVDCRVRGGLLIKPDFWPR